MSELPPPVTVNDAYLAAILAAVGELAEKVGSLAAALSESVKPAVEAETAVEAVEPTTSTSTPEPPSKPAVRRRAPSSGKSKPKARAKK